MSQSTSSFYVPPFCTATLHSSWSNSSQLKQSLQIKIVLMYEAQMLLHSRLIAAYIVGRPFCSQSTPQEVTPTSSHVPLLLTINGPPESPCNDNWDNSFNHHDSLKVGASHQGVEKRTSEPFLYSWCLPASVCESAVLQPKNGKSCSFFHGLLLTSQVPVPSLSASAQSM